MALCLRAFGRAAKSAELSTDDVSSYGMAAWRLGHGGESIRLSEEAFNRLVAENNTRTAAMKAADVALQWLNGGDQTITRVWVNRARRLLEHSPEDEAFAYLLYVDSQLSVMDGQYDAGVQRALELEEFVSRRNSPGLTALCLTASGLSKLPFARTSEAMADLDEAMMPVLAGQVPVDWAGEIYCAVIHECYRLGDLSRMKTWTNAMDKWREGPEVAASWYGTTCEVHKWQLLSATSDYRELEQRLVNALAAIEDFHAATAGEGHYELGDLRRRMGDIDGAREAFAKAREIGFEPLPGEALLRCHLGEDAAASNDLRMRMDVEQDEITRIRLLPAAIEIALAGGRLEEAERYCLELEECAEKYDSPGFRAWALHARGALLVKTGIRGRGVAHPAGRAAALPQHPTPLRDGTGLRVDGARPAGDWRQLRRRVRPSQRRVDILRTRRSADPGEQRRAARRPDEAGSRGSRAHRGRRIQPRPRKTAIHQRKDRR